MFTSNSSFSSSLSFSFIPAAMQEAVYLSLQKDNVDIDQSCFPFLKMSPQEQYKAGCKYCWDSYGNLFLWDSFPEVTGYINPTPVTSSPSPKKETFFSKVTALLNKKLF